MCAAPWGWLQDVAWASSQTGSPGATLRWALGRRLRRESGFGRGRRAHRQGAEWKVCVSSCCGLRSCLCHQLFLPRDSDLETVTLRRPQP